MTHDPLDDPMLDDLDQWHATAGTYSLDGTYIPDGTYVRLDDLPELIARVREDERCCRGILSMQFNCPLKDETVTEVQATEFVHLTESDR